MHIYLHILHVLQFSDKSSYLRLSYNPFDGQWTVTDEDQSDDDDKVTEQLTKASIH